jgi:RNA polymerase sigma factor (sigma-70 family)
MKKMSPPTHLEPGYLYKKYEPLRKSIFNKFKDRMSNQADKEDLISTIDIIFIQLVNEYDPNRGVDFPFYIKRMLDLRTYHHVTKYLKNVNKETYTDGYGVIIEDEGFEDIFNRIIDLYSIDPDLQLGEKHRNLMIGILIEGKSIQQLAEEEGVDPERLHARQYFLIKKLKKLYEEHKEKYGEDLY